MTAGIPTLAVISLGFLLGAYFIEREAEAAVLATVALFGILYLVPVLLLDVLWSKPKTVNVAVRAEAVVFSPPWAAFFVVTMAGGLAMLSLARLWWMPEEWLDLALYPRAMIFLGPVLGLYMIADFLWKQRRPAGLAVDERGLRGVRPGPKVDLEWRDLSYVIVAEGDKRRVLILALADGRAPLHVPESTVCGDVYAVATVIEYYLRHPNERGRLAHALDAVRHVDAEVSAGRFEGI